MIMAKLIVHQDKIPDPQKLIALCPFGAMEEQDGKVVIGSGCRMCRMCVKKGPQGAVEYIEEEEGPKIDKSAWKGIVVYVDHVDGDIHPAVSYTHLEEGDTMMARLLPCTAECNLRFSS